MGRGNWEADAGPDGMACGARTTAARTVAGRCRVKGRLRGTRAPTVRPNGPRAAERRPGAPSPTPGTVSSRARNGAVGDTGEVGGAAVDWLDGWGDGLVWPSDG